MTRSRLAYVTLCLLASVVPSGARTADPVALVEELQGSAPGVELLDFLPSGKVIRLSANAVLTVGYLKSCTHEVITGGIVTIGSDSSRIENGKVTRSRVECDGGRMTLSPEQSAQSGVLALRGKPPQPTRDPDQVLYGSSPLLRLVSPGNVRIERLDQKAALIEVAVSGKAPAYDFAKHGQVLVPGGLYRATGPGGETVFRIDPGARATGVPVIARLLRL